MDYEQDENTLKVALWCVYISGCAKARNGSFVSKTALNLASSTESRIVNAEFIIVSDDARNEAPAKSRMGFAVEILGHK